MAPTLAARLLGGGEDLRPVADVARQHQCLPTATLDLAGQLRQLGLTTCHQRDARSGAREAQRQQPAHAARGAGDQRCLALVRSQVRHAVTSLSTRRWGRKVATSTSSPLRAA